MLVINFATNLTLNKEMERGGDWAVCPIGIIWEAVTGLTRQQLVTVAFVIIKASC